MTFFLLFSRIILSCFAFNNLIIICFSVDFLGLPYLDFVEILRFVYPCIFSNLGNLWHRINIYKSLLNNKNTFQFCLNCFMLKLFSLTWMHLILALVQRVWWNMICSLIRVPLNKKCLNICIHWPLNMYILTLVHTDLWTTPIHLNRFFFFFPKNTFYNIGWSMVSWMCRFCSSWRSRGPVVKFQVDFPPSGVWVPLTHPHTPQPMLFKSKFYVQDVRGC